MQPSNTKSTRYQPKALYLVAMLLFCASLGVAFSVEYNLPWLNQAIALFPRPDSVQWRTVDQAWAECQKTHKPILYFAFGKKDTGSMLLEGQCLADPAVAALIESKFIPVSISYDYRDKDLTDSADFKYYRDKLGMPPGGAPWVAVVPYSLHGSSAQDLLSSANLVDLGVSSMDNLDSDQAFFSSRDNFGDGMGGFRGRAYNGRFSFERGGSTYSGYTDKQDFLDFLYRACLWHRLPPTIGRINWLPLATLRPGSKGNKPKLMAFLQDVGVTSDSMRLNLFWKNKSVDYINKNFEPYLIESHRLDPAANAAYNGLRKKYNIKHLPALLIIDSPGKGDPGPRLEYGFSSVGGSMCFLEAVLEPSAKARKQSLVPDYSGALDSE